MSLSWWWLRGANNNNNFYNINSSGDWNNNNPNNSGGVALGSSLADKVTLRGEIRTGGEKEIVTFPKG